MKLKRASELQNLDFYSDSLLGKPVAIRAIETKTETIPTQWGEREGLRVYAVAVNHDGTVTQGRTLSYWTVVNRMALQALNEDVDFIVGVPEVEPQKNDPTRTTVVFNDPSDEQFAAVAAAVEGRS